MEYLNEKWFWGESDYLALFIWPKRTKRYCFVSKSRFDLAAFDAFYHTGSHKTSTDEDLWKRLCIGSPLETCSIELLLVIFSSLFRLRPLSSESL